MKKKYLVELAEEEREYLHKPISSGSAPARKLNRARILLKADVGKHAEAQALSDRQIARMLETSTATVQRARERLYEGGLQAALERSKPDRVYKRSLEGRAEAHLIALACSEPPRGRNRWSLRLLADKAVELGIVEKVSHETGYVRHSKKRTQASPDQAVGDPTWVQRPVRVADGRDPGPLRRALRSEQTRSLLRRETLPALLAEVRESLACKPGKPKRADFEYERRGMANVLLAFEPLKGRREMRVTEHRRKLEFAAMMRYLLDDLYPEVERIRLVVDNLRARIHRQPSTRASLRKRQGVCLKRSSSSTRLQ